MQCIGKDKTKCFRDPINGIFFKSRGFNFHLCFFYLWILQFSPNHWADPLRRLARDSSRRQPRTNSSSFNSPAKILCWTLSILNNDIGLLRSCLKHPTIRVRRFFQLRVGLGSGICIKYQVNWVLSGIEILIGYLQSISLISCTF